MNNEKNQNNLIEPLKIALSLEYEGKQLFLKAAEETQSKLAKQTFEFLAAEEVKHIANIERFYKSMEDSKGKEIPDIEDSDADEKLESFNLKLESIKDDFKATSSDVEAYRLALRFENGAEEFYQEKFKEATDPRIKKFYKWLIDEESMHSRLLNSCLKFVEDPTEWFRNRKKI